MPRKVGVLAWLNVVLVGALVVGLVFGLRLTTRLNAGQRVVDTLKPAFTPDRAAGDRTGVNFVSHAVDLLDPVTTSKGTAASEIPKLVALLSSKTGLNAKDLTTTLQQKFPHTLALLTALPLSSVTAELPAFLDFVAAALKVPTSQLMTTLQTGFPNLYKAVANLQTVTAGWDNIPGMNGMTRFDNKTVVQSAPQLRDYLSQDLVPVVEKHQTDFNRVATYFPPVKDIPLLLLVIGGIAILYGLIMMLRAASTPKVGKKEGAVTWTVVLLLGLIVLGIVFGAQVYPRLDGGSHLVRDARPAFQPVRIAGDRAGITFISHVVDMADPIMNDKGKAGAEIATLLTTISSKTGLSQPALLAAVAAKFPHVAGLLQAVPLSAVSTELDALPAVLKASKADVVAALSSATPGLAAVVTNLPVVVNGWDNYPGGQKLTRFDGTAVMTAPQLRDYFANDVVATLEKVAPDFRTLDRIKPDLTLFPGLLTILGLLVVVYGIIMLIAVSMPDPDEELAARKARGPGGRRATGRASYA